MDDTNKCELSAALINHLLARPHITSVEVTRLDRTGIEFTAFGGDADPVYGEIFWSRRRTETPAELLDAYVDNISDEVEASMMAGEWG